MAIIPLFYLATEILAISTAVVKEMHTHTLSCGRSVDFATLFLNVWGKKHCFVLMYGFRK
jgi:hypothetical protein